MKAAVDAARRRIAGEIAVTACRPCRALSEASGARVLLKLENRQVSGSFKLRGVMNKVLTLTEDQRARGLVSASTGNHGVAFAHAVARLGLEGRLFLPRTASPTKLAAIEASGVAFELVGDDCVATEAHARTWAAERGMIWVSPYNDPAVVAGQGTVAAELVEQAPDLDAVLVPVGGGGLAAGVAATLAEAAPRVEVVGCQPAASPVMAASVAAGRIVEMASEPTLSDATAGGIEPGSVTFEPCRRHVARFVLLDEAEIAAAIRFLHRHEHMVVEGAAALSVAALLRRPPELAGRRVVAVVTGSRIDPGVLEGILVGRSR